MLPVAPWPVQVSLFYVQRIGDESIWEARMYNIHSGMMVAHQCHRVIVDEQDLASSVFTRDAALETFLMAEIRRTFGVLTGPLILNAKVGTMQVGDEMFLCGLKRIHSTQIAPGTIAPPVARPTPAHPLIPPGYLPNVPVVNTPGVKPSDPPSGGVAKGKPRHDPDPRELFLEFMKRTGQLPRTKGTCPECGGTGYYESPLTGKKDRCSAGCAQTSVAESKSPQ